MDCKHFEKLLGRYMDGGLDSASETELKEHIAQCAECARQFATLERIKESFSQMEDEPLPIGFEQRWKQQIYANPQPKKKPFTKMLPALAAGVAAIAIIGTVLATGVLNHTTPRTANMLTSGAAPQAAAGGVQKSEAFSAGDGNAQNSVMMAPAPEAPVPPAASAAPAAPAESPQMKIAADMAAPAPITVEVSADVRKKLENSFLSLDSVQIKFTSSDGHLTLLITDQNKNAVTAITKAAGLDISPQTGETYDFYSAE